MPYTDLSLKLCGKTNLPVLPSHIDLDLTNICNQDCFYCNSFNFRQKNLVQSSGKEYYKLIEQLYNWRKHTPYSAGTVRNINFTGGGEPTVHKDYHKIIEKAIDCNFLVSLITNGSKLNKLIDYLPQNKIKSIAWIGIDIDAGNKQTYEKIRRSLTKESLFDQVKDNIKRAVDKGYVCDVKALLMEENTSEKELYSLFNFAKDVQARKLHIRPIVDQFTNKLFHVSDELKMLISKISSELDVSYNLPQYRQQPRKYTKCHQMFLYPILAANGEISLCCEGRGQKRFVLGNWKKEDIRDLWFGHRHMEIYNAIDTTLCPPCKPNKVNNLIQDDINKVDNLERIIL